MEYHDGERLSHVGDVPAMGAHRYGEKTAIVLQEYGRRSPTPNSTSGRVAWRRC